MKRIGQILVILCVPTPFLSMIFKTGDVWTDFLVSAGFILLAIVLLYAGICLIEKDYYNKELRKMDSQARRERMAQRESALNAKLERQYAGKEMMAFLNAFDEEHNTTD